MRRRFVQLVSGVLTIALLPIATNVASGILPLSWRPYFWLSWPIIFLCALVVLKVQLQESSPRTTDTSLQSLRPDEDSAGLRQLAKVVETQWVDEATAEGLYRPRPLQLRWTAASNSSSQGAHWGKYPSASLALESHRPRGDLDTIGSFFNGLSQKRLIIVGEPGSGKTVLAMNLTLELIDSRLPDDPVPVMLSISSWDPTSEHLHNWLARRIEEDYRFLTHPEVLGHEAPLRLVLDALVIPILDGLDEMPDQLRGPAFDAINRLHGLRPIVVTCRTREYASEVRSEHHLPGATVIDIAPVDPADAADFLSAEVAPKSFRWRALIDHLRENRTSPCASALSTPFFISLVRYVYGNATDPAEIIDVERFPTRQGIERFLLDAFVESAYTTLLPGRAGVTNRRSNTYRPEVAKSWLAYLADYLERTRATDLRLWELQTDVHPKDLELAKRSILSISAAIIFGLIFWIAFSTSDAIFGVLTGISISVITIAALGLTEGKKSRRIKGYSGRSAPTFLRVAQAIVEGVLVALAMGLNYGAAVAVMAGALAALGFLLAFGPLIALIHLLQHRWIKHTKPAGRDNSPSFVHRLQRFLAELATALALGAFMGLVSGILAWIDLDAVKGVIAFSDTFNTFVLLGVVLLGLGLAGGRGAPNRVNLKVRGRIRELYRDLRTGLAVGIAYGLLAAAPLFAINNGIDLLLDVLRNRELHISQRALLQDLTFAALAICVCIVCGLARGFAGWLNTPVKLATAPSPMAVLSAFRTASLTWAIVGVLVLESMVAVANLTVTNATEVSRATYGIAWGSAVGVVGALLALIGSSWGDFWLTRAVLASYRVLPWRLVQFMNDSRTLGVLRQAGPSYQFRHAHLQERLTTRDRSF